MHGKILNVENKREKIINGGNFVMEKFPLEDIHSTFLHALHNPFPPDIDRFHSIIFYDQCYV